MKTNQKVLNSDGKVDQQETRSGMRSVFAQTCNVDRAHRAIYPEVDRSYVEWLSTPPPKAAEAEGDPSKLSAMAGRRYHPVNYANILKFLASNEYHSAAIWAKVYATVGLGLRRDFLDSSGDASSPSGEPIENPAGPSSKLDPLCRGSFQEVLNRIALDFFQCGQSPMEIDKREGDRVTGIHRLPITGTYIVIEADGKKYHYAVSYEGRSEIIMAPWGQRQRLIKDGIVDRGTDPRSIAEVVHFRMPSSLDDWYGTPDWLSAAPSIELDQTAKQFATDFYLNRCVPEWMLFILGKKIQRGKWDNLMTGLRRMVGFGRSHQAFATNIESQDVKVQLERLGTSITDGSFKALDDSLAVKIVSAHRVPPVLAGIQVAGRLGGTQEMDSAMRVFQALVIGPAQRYFERTLAMTLGSPAAGLGLTPADFEMRTILDELIQEPAVAQPAAGAPEPGMMRPGDPGKAPSPRNGATMEPASAGAGTTSAAGR